MLTESGSLKLGPDVVESIPGSPGEGSRDEVVEGSGHRWRSSDEKNSSFTQHHLQETFY